MSYSGAFWTCQPVDADPLTPVFAPLTSLRGIGPTVAGLIARVAGGDRLVDLLFHLPDSYLDRRNRPTIRDALVGTVATLAVEVVRHERPATSRQPWRIIVKDDTGIAELVFFKFTREQQMPPGARLLVSGKIDLFNGRVTIAHPEHVVPADQPEKLPGIEPVWPLTAGLWPRQVANAMRQALAQVPALPEWHDPALLRREKWPGFLEALRMVQAPEEAGEERGALLPLPLREGDGGRGPASTFDVVGTRPATPLPQGEGEDSAALLPDPTYLEKARARLAYDEFLAGQVALAVIRGRVRARPGRILAGDSHLRAKALERFGFTPTASQRQALQEIDADLASNRRMLRLLQGDVGSGKTLVALLAMLRAVEAGAQAALMAPTEVLAKQHHRTLTRLCPVPVALLTGSIKGRERMRLLRGLKDGSIPLVVGTHALFQDAVEYHDLALAVIDEQHRFGVDQRLLLGGKGEHTDVLVMTATPIPRTLLLTQWGEMEVSRLTEKPAGRQPIRTTLHSLGTLPDILDGIARTLDRGAQVYWVCPLVAESEALDLAAAEDRFATLHARFGDRVGLAHGQQSADVRDAALAAFAAGKIRLLVATTVIEVGVDVPEASVMVIEHAERFGLAQLHQLRGRVGRGSEVSFCLLLHEDWVSETARRRLTLLRDTDDGFLIADEDFRLRGAGDVLGTRQAGAPGFRLADPIEHEPLLHMAHRDAQVLLSRDPKLTSERGKAVRMLLRLFERTAAMKTLAAG
ncbi:MAG: ATP-dependent DNA helicase RecG [Acetobacteraceae bacterium]|nr:ATP-dependent DNA helicase RecG [Acetobacteraceae bacterium]